MPPTPNILLPPKLRNSRRPQGPARQGRHRGRLHGVHRSPLLRRGVGGQGGGGPVARLLHARGGARDQVLQPGAHRAALPAGEGGWGAVQRCGAPGASAFRGAERFSSPQHRLTRCCCLPHSPTHLSPPTHPHPTPLQNQDESDPPNQQAEDRLVAQIGSWLGRISCLVVGPGLGDDAAVVAVSKRVVAAARDAGLPLLVDGSGLNFIAEVCVLIMGRVWFMWGLKLC